MQTTYLLDTNICIYIAKHNPPAVREKFSKLNANQLAMSVVTLGELRFGAEKSLAKEKSLAIIDQLTRVIRVEDLVESVGEHYGDIRAQLQAQGKVIGNNDLWLAAHARSQNWVLVTNNEKEFLRVENLVVENWV